MKYFFVIFVMFIFTDSASALVESDRNQLRQLEEWYPYYGCQDEKVFRQCFKWTREECEVMTMQTIKSCLNLNDPRFRLSDGVDLDHWKEKIIFCSLKDLQIKLKTRIVDSLLCKNKGVTK